MISKPFISIGVLAVLLLGSAAVAEPFDHNGYVLGCTSSGCAIFSAGVMLQVANDGSTPARIISQLARLQPIAAVHIKGDLGELGDSTASLTLTGLAEVDDPKVAVLRALQGKWASAQGFAIGIAGLEWQDLGPAADAPGYLITPGNTCADGTAPAAAATLVLSLYVQGGDPSEAACWQVDHVDDKTLRLTDLKGDKGQVTLTRTPD